MAQLALQTKLDRTRLFWRALLVLEGLFRTAAILVFLFTVCFHLDLHLVLSLEARMRVWQVLGALGLVGAALWIVRPVLRRRTAAEIAAMVERRFPQLGERLLSAVEFAQGGRDRLDGVSPAMVERLREEAEAEAARIDFRRAIRPDGLLRSLLWLLLAGIVLGLHLWLAGPAFSAYLSRMALNNTPVWRETRVQVEPFPSVKVLKGTGLDVTVRQEGKRQKLAHFYYRYAEGRWSEADLKPEADGNFRYHFASLTEPVTFYATAGDGQSDRGKATIVDAAAVIGATIRLRYPAYLDEPPAVVTSGSGGIAAPAGTTAEVDLKASKPLNEARVTLPGHAPAAWGVHRDRLQGTVPVSRNGSYQVALRDLDGFPASPQSFPIQVIPDRAPEIELVRPTGTLELVPDATVRLAFRAQDDHGINEVRVAYQPEGRQPAARPAGHGDRHAKSLEAESSWPLAPLALKPGSVVRYHLEATDWDNVGGPHVGRTGELQIRIIDRGEAERRYEDDRTQLLQDLKTAIREQQEIRAQVDAARNQPRPDTAALAAAAQKQTALGTKAADLARRLNDLNQAAELNNLATPEEVRSQRTAQNLLENVAKQDVPQATSRIETAHQQAANNPQVAKNELNLAAQQQQAVSRDLKQASELLQPGSPLQRIAERFDRLAAEQQALAQQSARILPETAGKSAPELTPAQQQQLGQLAQRQQSLQRATAQAIQDLQRTAQTLAPVNPAQATAAQRATEALQAAEVPGQQQQAAQNVQQNLLGQAASQQQASAQALRQASRQLQQAQQANGDAQNGDMPPSDPFEQTRQALQNLVAQQTAINQGSQRLAQQPRPDAAQQKALAQRQAQVQKNTAALQKTLPGQTLQSFAQQAQAAMRRSETGLRQGNPPNQATRQAQAQALRNLQTLATALDPANLAPAAQNPEAQQTLAELSALRTAQQAVQAETQALDAARPPGPPLTPEQQAQAAALAQEQRRIQAQTDAVARRAPAGTSPLRQAGQHMAQAERGLQQQQTGNPVQAQQQQALDALASATAQVQQQAARNAQNTAAQQAQRGEKGRQAGRKDEQRPGGVQNGALNAHAGGGHGFTALQPHTQDALRQGYKEKIPADYQDLVKRYYRTLSERAH